MPVKLNIKQDSVNNEILQEVYSFLNEQDQTSGVQKQDRIGGKGKFGELPEKEKLKILQKGVSLVKDIQNKLNAKGIKKYVYDSKENLQKYNKFLKDFQDRYNALGASVNVDSVTQILNSIQSDLEKNLEPQQAQKTAQKKELTPAREAFIIKLQTAFKDTGISFTARQRNLILRVLKQLVRSGVGISLSEAEGQPSISDEAIKKAIDYLLKLKEFSNFNMYNKQAFTAGMTKFLSDYKSSQQLKSIAAVPVEPEKQAAQPPQQSSEPKQQTAPTDLAANLQKQLLAKKISQQVSSAVSNQISAELEKLFTTQQQPIQEAFEQEFANAKQIANNIINKINEQNVPDADKIKIFQSVVELAQPRAKTPDSQFFIKILNKQIVSLQRSLKSNGETPSQESESDSKEAKLNQFLQVAQPAVKDGFKVFMTIDRVFNSDEKKLITKFFPDINLKALDDVSDTMFLNIPQDNVSELTEWFNAFPNEEYQIDKWTGGLPNFKPLFNKKPEQPQQIDESLFRRFTLNKQKTNKSQLFRFDGDTFKKYNRG